MSQKHSLPLSVSLSESNLRGGTVAVDTKSPSADPVGIVVLECQQRSLHRFDLNI